MKVELIYQLWAFRFLYIEEKQILFYLSHLHLEYPYPKPIITGMTNNMLINKIKIMA